VTGFRFCINWAQWGRANRAFLWLLRRMTLGLMLLSVAGCAELGYYAQSVEGHLGLMARRVPVERLLGADETPEQLRDRLALAQRIRRFASNQLALPDNRSYRDYVDVERPYVVWNVVVAPELSLDPKRWCFPVVGCVSYRGYYDEVEARAFAAGWRAAGYDVSVGGVRAYSTLGWFADPLLSTMLRGSDTYLAGVIFHELAHQVVYIDDDTAFNEAFAVSVEREGLRRWLAERERSHGLTGAVAHYNTQNARHQKFLDLIRRVRSDLAKLYESGLSAGEKRAEKQTRFDRLAREYATLRASWGGYAGYDAWFSSGPNNAKLALLATYWQKVPAFERLLANKGYDLPRFYAAVAAIGVLPRAEREARLTELANE